MFITETVRPYPIRKLKDVRQKWPGGGAGHPIPGYGRHQQIIIKEAPRHVESASHAEGQNQKGDIPLLNDYPSCFIRANSRRAVHVTRHNSRTAATVRPTMNPIQMPRAPMAGTIQSVLARM